MDYPVIRHPVEPWELVTQEPTDSITNFSKISSRWFSYVLITQGLSRLVKIKIFKYQRKTYNIQFYFWQLYPIKSV